jgi:hypothetical protein
VLALPASAATPPRVFKNCKAVNKDGVARET